MKWFRKEKVALIEAFQKSMSVPLRAPFVIPSRKTEATLTSVPEHIKGYIMDEYTCKTTNFILLVSSAAVCKYKPIIRDRADCLGSLFFDRAVPANVFELLDDDIFSFEKQPNVVCDSDPTIGDQKCCHLRTMFDICQNEIFDNEEHNPQRMIYMVTKKI